MAQNLLHTFTCLVSFLTHEDMDQLPYLLATSLPVIPPNLHKDVLDILCFNLLPFTIRNVSVKTKKSTFNGNANGTDLDEWQQENFGNVSVSSILMMFFQHTDSSTFNTQLFETLMQLKRKNFFKNFQFHFFHFLFSFPFSKVIF